MNENEWDKLLKIHTTGTDNTDADQYRYPYEPTPYSVLERLGNSGWIRKENTLLDYGCGKGRVDYFMAYQTKCKGRVDFFLSYQTRCRSIGIEYNERIYAKAVENKETAISAERVNFIVVNAEQFSLPLEVDRIYFFNPFSLEILRKVMARIRESYYEKPRRMQLYFYYPSEEYMAYLMTVEELTFLDEIDCRDLFSGDNPRERIVIFEF